jgi:hypothetical protein
VTPETTKSIPSRGECETILRLVTKAPLSKLAFDALDAKAYAGAAIKLPSGILEDYPLKYVRDIFSSVSGIFQMPIELTPFDYLAGISRAKFEQLS